MQQHVIIEYNGNLNKSDTFLECSFRHPILGQVNILDNHKVVVGQLSPGEKTLRLPFNKMKPNYEYKYDDEKDERMVRFFQYLTQNPIVQFPGNTYCKNPQFKVTNLAQQKKIDVLDIKRKGAVFNAVSNMTIKEMRDAAFYYGLNPIRMSVDEIFVKLIDFSSGVLMLGAEDFLTSYHNPDTQYAVVARKAMLLDIITQKGNQYLLNQEIIGTDIADIISRFKTNPEEYQNYVYKEVMKRDLLPADIDLGKTVEKVVGAPKQYSNAVEKRKERTEALIQKAVENVRKKDDVKEENVAEEGDDLVAEAQRLKIKGLQFLKKNPLKLKAAVEQKRAEISEQKKMEEAMA